MQLLKTNRLLNLVLGIAILDGGFVIAVQIFTFLITHFFAQIPSDPASLQSFSSVGKANFIISIISMLNLAVILYRISCIANGFKPDNFTCYKQAVRRLPFLIVLYLVGSIMLVALAIPTIQLLTSFFNVTLTKVQPIIIISMLALIPYALLACVYVIYEEKSPLKAIIATYKIVKHKISINMLAILSMLYAMPYCLKNFIPTIISAPYLALLTSLWFLFCHILTIVVYADTVEIKPVTKDKEEPKTTKVIIV